METFPFLNMIQSKGDTLSGNGYESTCWVDEIHLAGMSLSKCGSMHITKFTRYSSLHPYSSMASSKMLSTYSPVLRKKFGSTIILETRIIWQQYPILSCSLENWPKCLEHFSVPTSTWLVTKVVSILLYHDLISIEKSFAPIQTTAINIRD